MQRDPCAGIELVIGEDFEVKEAGDVGGGLLSTEDGFNDVEVSEDEAGSNQKTSASAATGDIDPTNAKL